MEPQPPKESAFVPLSQVKRTDQVCDQFEAAWKAGPRPRFDDFLADVPPAQWSDLLRELLILDLDYRRQLGESPTLEEYRAAYPALELDRFASLFVEASQPASSRLTEETLQYTPRETQTPDGKLPRIHYLGDYELLAEIAHGGMGVVYKARQLSLNRLVAVKMVLAGQLATKADHDRFHAEAQAAALLDHPNIVPVFEVGDYEGQHYFSMGYVDGQSLTARLAEGPLPPKEAVELVATVAEAVEYAHRLGVIHRDIKPSNILIDSSGRPRVTDFGLAKRIDSGSDLTATGQILGTPSYMPPEQAAGQVKAVGPAADVYALGATLYAALTGRPPFQSATPLETLKQVIEREPVPLRQLNAAVPRDLETIVLKCLEKSVPRRYATALALAEDLRRYLEGRPIVARPVGRWERAWRWCRRQPVVAGLSTAAALLAVLVAVASTVGYVSTGALHQVLDKQRADMLAEVDDLRTAEISRVPDLIEGLRPVRAEIEPQLRQLLQQPDLAEKERLRLSLALVANDAGQVGYLSDRLLTAEPAELLVIRTALLPHRDELAAPMWLTAADPAAAKDRRFRALFALAAFDPASPRWKNAGKPAAEALLAEKTLLALTWAEALRPVRLSLLPGLQAVFGGREYDDSERMLATGILVDYAADQPRVLADLLMDADEKQFAVIFPKLKTRGEQGMLVLTGEIDRTLPLDSTDDTKEKLARRKVNAGVALLRMDQPTKVWLLLKHSSDPRVRSYLIHGLGPLGADAKTIVKRLDEEPDATIRRALLLSLGEFGEKAFSLQDRQGLRSKLQDIYRSETDPGLHAAAEWLLRIWKHDAWLKEVNEEWAKDKQQREKRLSDIKQTLAKAKEKTPTQWYVNGQGQTMVVIPGPVEFAMGSPPTEVGRAEIELQHKMRIGRTFAIDAKPVTMEQYQQYDKGFAPAEKKFTRTAELPAMGINWYMAAAYCNWLSKQEGIGKDQWCYETGATAPVTKLRKNYLSLTGYRLPTEAEMEYATRVGASTSRFFGATDELLPQYAWYQKNAQNQTWPVGSLKPNDLGLFDVQGNVFTWCQESAKNCQITKGEVAVEDVEDGLVIEGLKDRMLRGGWFYADASNVRSACRNSDRPSDRNLSVGFRVARTCR